MKIILKVMLLVWSAFIGLNCIQAEVIEEDFDKIYNAVVENDIVYIDSIVSNDSTQIESLFIFSLSKYQTENISLYLYCDDLNYNSCHLKIYDKYNDSNFKEYDVKVVFNDSDVNIKSEADMYINKFPKNGEDEKYSLFKMDDLDVINYLYNEKQIDSFGPSDNIINYSSEFQNLISNSIFETILYSRAGWDKDFSLGRFGDMMLFYNDFVYAVTSYTGVKGVYVIYIPDDTENTREAFINAAKKRIDSYLGNDSIKITYGGQISEIDYNNWIIPLSEIVNVDNTIGEYYVFNINGEDYKFFIEKNSEKMLYTDFWVKDDISNAIITSDSKDIPSDTVINFEYIDKNSDEFENILKILGLNDAISANISLYSSSKNEYITNLVNGKFKVYFPIPKEMENKKLMAYYITSANKIEKYPVTIIDGYAVFETNHFSVYTIGEEISNSNIEDEIPNIENPETNDNILNFIILGFISIFGLIISGLNIKKIKKINY